MKKLLVSIALASAGTLFLAAASTGHGGTYRGPGDTVPPGGGGAGGGGGPAGPGAGGPNGMPGLGGPSTASPGVPTGAGARPSGGADPGTGGALAGPDLTGWSFWWEFNKNPYLNLKAAILSDVAWTGSDELTLGLGEKRGGRDSLAPTALQIRQMIVPALMRALETETNNDIVTGSLIALARIGDAAPRGTAAGDAGSELQDVIAPFLQDGNQEIRETAALALGILANPESIPLLIDLLHDTQGGREAMGKTEVDYRTRAFAAYGLALVGSKSRSEDRAVVVDALVAMLDSDRSSTRDISVACLLALGLVPVTPIEPLAVVGDTGEPPAPSTSRAAQIEYLLGYFQDDSRNFMIRAHAPTSIVRLMRDLPTAELDGFKARVAPAFLAALSKRSKAQREIQQSCVLALGEITDDDGDELDAVMRATLLGITRELSDAQTRNYSMIALGMAAGHAGAGPEPGAGGEELQQHLLATMARGKRSLRPWAALGLGVQGELLWGRGEYLALDAQRALLVAMGAEANPERFGAYAIACGMARVGDSEEQLLRKLEELRTNAARGYACLALGMLNALGAVETIESIVQESTYRPELLQQAAIALGLLGDKRLVGDLIVMLRDARGLATQAALANALGFIGDRNSVEPLVEMLENEEITETARGFAAVALGIVGDKEWLPWNSGISAGVNYRASTRTLNDTEGSGVLNIL